jgi:hypothetical protein
MADYQNGHMAGSDDNVGWLTSRRSMTVGECALLHSDVLNGNSDQQ